MLKLHKICATIFNGYRLKVEEVLANFNDKKKEQKKLMRGKSGINNLLMQKLNYCKMETTVEHHPTRKYDVVSEICSRMFLDLTTRVQKLEHFAMTDPDI